MNRDRADKVLTGALDRLRVDYLAEMEIIEPLNVESLLRSSTKLWVLREIRHDVEKAIQQIEGESWQE